MIAFDNNQLNSVMTIPLNNFLDLFYSQKMRLDFQSRILVHKNNFRLGINPRKVIKYLKLLLPFLNRELNLLINRANKLDKILKIVNFFYLQFKIISRYNFNPISHELVLVQRLAHWLEVSDDVGDFLLEGLVGLALVDDR